MNKNGIYLLILAVFFCFGLTNCQCSRQIKCSALSHSREVCLQDTDCQAVTYPTCRGQLCQTTYCQPSLEKNACVLENALVTGSCARDARTFSSGGIPADIAKYTWAFEKLSEYGKSLAGKKLTKEDLAQLTSSDSGAICGAFANDPCKLEWDEEKQSAICATGPIDCTSCEFVNPKFQCSAINKCNGVICL